MPHKRQGPGESVSALLFTPSALGRNGSLGQDGHAATRPSPSSSSSSSSRSGSGYPMPLTDIQVEAKRLPWHPRALDESLIVRYGHEDGHGLQQRVGLRHLDTGSGIPAVKLSHDLSIR